MALQESHCIQESPARPPDLRSIAMRHRPPIEAKDNKTAFETWAETDAAAFEKWAKLAVEAARLLAPFQSPTYQAIMLAPVPEEPRTRNFTLEIFEGGKPVTDKTAGGKIIEH